MPTVHNSLIQRELKKYRRKGWLAFTEVRYGDYIFDILAFNPKTKEVEVVEVDVGHTTSPEKVKFAESFGKVRFLRATSKTVKVNKELQALLNALGDPIRIKIMEILAQKRMQYAGLMYEVNLNPLKDAGRFAYHLKFLHSVGIIEKEGNKYALSKKGEKILNFFKNLEQESINTS